MSPLKPPPPELPDEAEQTQPSLRRSTGAVSGMPSGGMPVQAVQGMPAMPSERAVPGTPGDVVSSFADAARLLERLRELGWTVGVAESLTGGLVVSALIAVPGASDVVRGGVVAYATELKHSLLGVDRTLLEAHGAVHPRVARQMADGVRARLGLDGMPCDVGIATTGIAGPDSPDGQPVGTVHIGVATPLGTRVESLELGGTRDEIRAASVRQALRITLEAL